MAITPPPLLASFSSIDELLEAVRDITTDGQQREIRELVKRGLPPAVSSRVVACLFGVSPRFVGAIARKPKNYYRTFTIRRGRKLRTIESPRIALKILQKWFATHLAASIAFPPHVYGFVKGQSYFGAALAHCEKDWVASIDIQDFFPSITKELVIASLQDVGYSSHSSELISRLCCLGGRLPQGSPASPVISNLVFEETDESLLSFCMPLGVTYTRYADDLVFSGYGSMPDDFIVEVTRIVEADGWTIASRKTQWSCRPSRLKVHGLLVQGDVPKLTRGYRNKIRAYSHLLGAGRVSSKDVDRLRGHVEHANNIDRQASTAKKNRPGSN